MKSEGMKRIDKLMDTYKKYDKKTEDICYDWLTLTTVLVLNLAVLIPCMLSSYKYSFVIYLIYNLISILVLTEIYYIRCVYVYKKVGLSKEGFDSFNLKLESLGSAFLGIFGTAFVSCIIAGIGKIFLEYYKELLIIIGMLACIVFVIWLYFYTNKVIGNKIIGDK